MNHGGKLRPEHRSAWARCYVRFIEEYAKEGVPIWGVSVQNEPAATQRWDSCIYSAEEERDFVRDHLGPALHAAGLGHIHIVIWDHNRDLMVERASVIYADAAGGEVRVGHRLSLVRRRPLRPCATGARRLARQAPAVHRRLPGRRPAQGFVGSGRALRAIDDQRPEPLDRRLDRLEPAARRPAAARTTSATCAARRSSPTRRAMRCCTRVRTGISATSRASSDPARSACFALPREPTWKRRPSSTSTARHAVIALNRSEAPIAFSLRVGAHMWAAELPARSIATYVAGTQA